MDSGIQGKFCLPALQIIPIRNELSYIRTNASNEPMLELPEVQAPSNSSNFVLELSEVVPLYKFIELLNNQAICDKNVIILLNVVVIRNP